MVKPQLEEHQPLYLCATANNIDALKLHAESQNPFSLSSTYYDTESANKKVTNSDIC